MRWLVLAVLAAAAGCQGKAPKHELRGCNLAGTYRLRFDAHVGQWLWFRFRVDDRMETATMLPPFAVDHGTKLTLEAEPQACKLSVLAKSDDDSDLLAQVTLEPKTNQVKGTLRLARSRDSVKLVGVRDVGAPIVANKCLVPGVFDLVVPAEQAWKNPEGKSCEHAALRVRFMVEPFGDDLVIDQLDPKGDAEWGAEDVYQDGPCTAEVRFRHNEWITNSKLVFGGETVTATMEDADMQVSDHGDVYRCKIASPMAWVERVSTSLSQ